MYSIVLEEYTFLELLDGNVEVMHLGRLNKGTCMFVRGVLSVKTIINGNDDTSLWMISLINGKNKFGIVSYKEALEKPIIIDSPILKSRNCTIFKSKEIEIDIGNKEEIIKVKENNKNLVTEKTNNNKINLIDIDIY